MFKRGVTITRNIYRIAGRRLTTSLVMILNRKFLKKISMASYHLGDDLFGYLNFLNRIDQNGFLRIPSDIKRLRVDVGLSFAAPNSAVWLENDKELMVFGFEPNPNNISELITGENKKRGPQYRYLNRRLIGERLLLFNIAIDDGSPSLKTFYMTDGDPGTSSLYFPRRFKIERAIKVPTIALRDFFKLIPWDRFKYIEHLKIDTQGNDYNVLKSAGEYLSEKVVYITAEMSTGDQYTLPKGEHNINKLLIKSGFLRYSVPINNNCTYLNSRYKKFAREINPHTEGR